MRGMDEKWFGHKLTRDELRNYIKKSRKGYQGNAFIGRVTEKKKRIRDCRLFFLRKI
jgi:hypothetical protein